MKTEQNTYQRWLEAAYEQFAEVGPDHLNVNALSKATGLPRTNFYYYFPDSEYLMEQLLLSHIQLSAEYEAELKKNLKVFIPDLYEILFRFKTGVKFHWQLFKNRNNIRLAHTYHIINKSACKFIVPKVKNYYNLDMPESAVKAIWIILIDAWYAQLDFDDYTTESLSSLTEETMQTILKFASLISSKGTVKPRILQTLDTPV